jgi:hypothetical protein
MVSDLQKKTWHSYPKPLLLDVPVCNCLLVPNVQHKQCVELLQKRSYGSSPPVASVAIAQVLNEVHFTLDLNLTTSAMKKLLPTLRLVQRTVFPHSILFLTSFRKGGSFQHPS